MEAALRVKVLDREPILAVEPLNLDELKEHVDAIDAAILPIQGLDHRPRWASVTLKVLHQRLTTSRQLSDHDDAKLARVADELASVARDLHPELGGPPDPKGCPRRFTVPAVTCPRATPTDPPR